MNKLKNIKNPSDLNNLSNEDLEQIASEIRELIIQTVSENGGHLSANLGIVDLTVALCKVFDPSKDKIIFDVGHQCYAYKILTERLKSFNMLRKKDGISGFQSMKESSYDVYEAGHSSTSISAGLGMALARDIDNKAYNVISIIGDGSIGNGLAYEALNHIGSINTKQIIILNDNQMSISQNVGMIHNILDNIRSNDKYYHVKDNTKSFLKKIFVGKWLILLIDKIKRNLKKFYVRKGALFDSLGIEYYGPINGHDYKELIKYLNISKRSKKSVLLHVITQKGKGYLPAEKDINGKYHGIGPFNIKTGEVINKNNLPSFSEVISSYVYTYAKENHDIICITPGTSLGSKLDTIKEKLPKQYIDVGIAEEHALVMANGLALSNKIPIVFIYSTFLQRGYDEIVHDIARMNSHVIICVDRAGFVSDDGISHQGLFDVPMLMNVPNLIITNPSNALEANDLLFTAIKNQKPFVIRYPKTNLKYNFHKAKTLKLGLWQEEIQGTDGYLITYGDFVNKAINVSKELSKAGINLSVINAFFIKPIDENLYNKIINDNKPIFIYEESMKIGSLGSFLSVYCNNTKFNNIFKIYAVNDIYQCTATREELIKINNLDEEFIINDIKKEIKKFEK